MRTRHRKKRLESENNNFSPHTHSLAVSFGLVSVTSKRLVWHLNAASFVPSILDEIVGQSRQISQHLKGQT
ncbi:hypothetical protein ACTXT7_001859 [Hymenolepis weldensis]